MGHSTLLRMEHGLGPAPSAPAASLIGPWLAPPPCPSARSLGGAALNSRPSARGTRAVLRQRAAAAGGRGAPPVPARPYPKPAPAPAPARPRSEPASRSLRRHYGNSNSRWLQRLLFAPSGAFTRGCWCSWERRRSQRSPPRIKYAVG